MNTGIDAKYERTDSKKWLVTIDGPYVSAIKEHLQSDGIPENGINKIVENAARTLSYGPCPQKNDNCQKTGIVIGKVQSGKTSNFITLTAMAFDNGYNIVLVLGGTKRPLVTQNRERIRDYFSSKKDIIVLDTVDYKSELTTNKIQQFAKMGKKIIIVVLKNSTQINYVKDNVFENSFFVDKPVLIIDDEGDEASLNTLVNKGKKSSTYSAIESLKSILNKHCFISVTATPQANLLIDTLDILSPDFGVLVDPGSGYCGLDVFHSDDKYTVEIPSDETSLLDRGIPHSFIKALSMFFVACAIQLHRGLKPGEKMSMLIHPSQKIADHKSVYSKVTKLIDDWVDASQNKDDIAYMAVRRNLFEAYNEYAKAGVSDIPSFNQIEDDIIQIINMSGKHIVNGDIVGKSADDIYDYNIYVGGTMLGRGLTLKGLTITYIIRTAKGVTAADTVQQRARWFGYKTKYLDLCRIFAVSKIIKQFRDIRDHEEDLWETIKMSNMQGENFKDMARIFVLNSEELRPTRPNVASVEKYTFTFWNKQRVFQSVEEYVNNNIMFLNNFKKKHRDDLVVTKYGTGAPYTIITSDYMTVYKEILSSFCFPEGSKLSVPLISKLNILLQKKNLNPKIDVIWMRDGETSKHSIDLDGTIPNYSVGRRPQDLSQPAVYLGDDYQFKKNDTMQLQIHYIENIRTHMISPTLALFLPISVVEKLTNLIIKV